MNFASNFKGVCYENGKGISKNHEKARRFI